MSRTPESRAQESRNAEQATSQPQVPHGPAKPQNPTHSGRAGSELPTKSVRLGRTEAALWLEHIRGWLANEETYSADLDALRDALENACWLARWKREDVVLELCPGVVAGLLETLVRMHLENSEEMADALEAMVRKLSGS